VPVVTSFVEFDTYIDSRKGSRRDKDEIKAKGRTLARAAIREVVDHTVQHLNAAVVDNPTDMELLARVVQMKKYLATVRLVDG
jgi:hypothetical protein